MTIANSEGSLLNRSHMPGKDPLASSYSHKAILRKGLFVYKVCIAYRGSHLRRLDPGPSASESKSKFGSRWYKIGLCRSGANLMKAISLPPNFCPSLAALSLKSGAVLPLHIPDYSTEHFQSVLSLFGSLRDNLFLGNSYLGNLLSTTSGIP